MYIPLACSASRICSYDKTALAKTLHNSHNYVHNNINATLPQIEVTVTELGLPDGLFSNQKSQFWENFQAL
jgi:hypothetical protein